jgi:outer membrane protein assembly factor BamA
MRRLLTIYTYVLVLMWAAVDGRAQGTDTNQTDTAKAPSKLRSAEDGQFDVSGFLDEKYGFLPIVLPITEPAVGYGAAGGLAFISSPLANAQAGYGRPNITMVAGMGTGNGSWGGVVGDMRHWFDDKVQTLAGAVYASVNLDFYGVGANSVLDHDPLRYNLQPMGFLLQGRYRIADSRFWAGLNYAFARTRVHFDAPAGTPELPEFERESNVGGFTPSLTFDSRDNIFTPTRGTYVEASAGLFSQALGADTEFQRVRVIGMQYFQLNQNLFLGFRGDVAASFGDEPFYLRPFINMRGVPIMRYQGDEIAQIESELRWQFWKRFSVVGFVGGGAAWNNLDHFDNTQSVVSGGTGFRYELARKYGIHAGLDVAFSRNTTAIYVQIGSAWMRP